jgi:hypothetical protein
VRGAKKARILLRVHQDASLSANLELNSKFQNFVPLGRSTRVMMLFLPLTFTSLRSITLASLLAPEAHIHLSVHHGRGGQILLGLLWFAGAAIELAQA